MKPEVVDVVASVLQIPRERVTDSLDMNNCAEWDSLAHVELMVALESAYGLTVDEDQIFDLVTLQAIRSFVDRHAGDASGAALG